MARRRRGVNVSEAIRNYLKENPEVGPTAAAAAVSEQVGKKVTPTYVSNIKGLANGKGKPKGKPGRKPGRPKALGHAENNGLVAIDVLLNLKHLIGQIGAERAKALIDVLS